MIEYDTMKKLKEAYEQLEKFERKWVSPKGIYHAMHLFGGLDDQDLEDLTKKYDEVMKPVHDAEHRIKKAAVEKTQKLLWTYGLMKKDPKDK